MSDNQPVSRRQWCLASLAALNAPRAGAAPGNPTAGRRRTSFNQDWRFRKGEADAAGPAFDDREWRRLDVPHDWAIEGPFDRQYNARCGGLPFHGVAWYRKRFNIGEPEGREYRIEFDGAMSNARVWLNGHELGERPYGYIGFAFDLTPWLRFGGQENVIAVRLAPEDNSSRWYPGAGIYRNVWLDVTGPVHVSRWGTFVSTPEVTAGRATVMVRAEISNRAKQAAQVTVETSILDASGRQVARTAGKPSLAAGATEVVEARLEVQKPRRWDIDDPYLYTAVTEIKQGAVTLDRHTTPFGIRTIEFDARRGFLLNGRYLKLKGVCMHHDLGALGAAVNRRATERQLEIMKGMGVNAIRTSHNPPSPEQLDLCDRLGLLVMDEAFDMWRMPKVPNGYSKYFDQWAERDLRDMLRRDRNHPSIIMWSIGNEILEQGKPEGAKVARWLTGICHQEDRTRPVTAGFNNWVGATKNGLADEVDIQGLNYKPTLYESTLKEHPKWVIFGSETSSCVSSRGVYHLPIEKYDKHESLQVTSYDIIAPPWAYAPDVEFEAQDRMQNVLGEFVWTGFDYLGEPTPYGGRDNATKGQWSGDWPSRSSYFGVVDLCGFPKDRYYLYKSVWTAEPVLHILPHWNWKGREGQSIPVVCYTNCEEVELFLNGRSLGRKRRGAGGMELPVGPNVSAFQEVHQPLPDALDTCPMRRASCARKGSGRVSRP